MLKIFFFFCSEIFIYITSLRMFDNSSLTFYLFWTIYFSEQDIALAIMVEENLESNQWDLFTINNNKFSCRAFSFFVLSLFDANLPLFDVETSYPCGSGRGKTGERRYEENDTHLLGSPREPYTYDYIIFMKVNGPLKRSVISSILGHVKCSLD